MFRPVVWQEKAQRSCRHLSQILHSLKYEVTLNRQRTRKLLEERGVFSKKQRVACDQFSPIPSVIPAIEQDLGYWFEAMC